MHRRAVRRSQLVIGALAVLLAVPLASLPGAARADDDVEPEDTTTTVQVSPDEPELGETVTVTATISMTLGGAAVQNGWVDVDAAATEDDLWADEDAIELRETQVSGGTATAELTVDEETLAFLTEESEGFYLQAQYIPFDGEVEYDEYNASLSDPLHVELAAPEPTTTAVTAPSATTVDQPTALVATVTPATAVGTVTFSVDGAPVGAPTAVEGGVATIVHTFTQMGAYQVRATFAPGDPDAFEASSDTAGLQVSVQPGTTSIAVTGPDTATAHEAARLVAVVQPADADGSVTFHADGEELGAVDLVDGVATWDHYFWAEGESSVVASFTPAEGSDDGAATSAAHTVTVEPGTTSTHYGSGISVGPYGSITFGSRGCESSRAVAAPAQARRGGPGDPWLWFGPQLPAGTPFSPTILQFTPLALVPGFIKPVFSWFTQINFSACIFGFSLGRSGRAEETVTRVTGSVQCVPTETGFACPFDFPAFDGLTIDGELPMPAAFAGQQVDLNPTLTTIDPDTGETTVENGPETLVSVPKRTVLAAELAPKQAIASVKPGKAVGYRVQVRNAGIVTADKVKACVTVGKGAKITVAKGAKVTGQKACWTLPALKKGKALTKTFTVVAPSKKGDLAVGAVITPKKTQADVVRLATVVPVR